MNLPTLVLTVAALGAAWPAAAQTGAAPAPAAAAPAPAPAAPPPARALTEADWRAAAYLSANCANCHGTSGGGAPGAAMPRLAGLPRDYFVRQMQDFRDGRRTATLMHQIAKGYTDEQFVLMGEYFARQRAQ